MARRTRSTSSCSRSARWPSDTSAEPAVVAAALQDFSRYPALMLTLESQRRPHGRGLCGGGARGGRARRRRRGDCHLPGRAWRSSIARAVSGTLTRRGRATADRARWSDAADGASGACRSSRLAEAGPAVVAHAGPERISTRRAAGRRRRWSCRRWPAAPRTRRRRSSGKASATRSISRQSNCAA